MLPLEYPIPFPLLSIPPSWLAVRGPYHIIVHKCLTVHTSQPLAQGHQGLILYDSAGLSGIISSSHCLV